MVVAFVIVVVLALGVVALLVVRLRSASAELRAVRAENDTNRARAKEAEDARSASEEAARRSADAAAAQSAAAAGRIATLETTVAKQADAAARDKAELAKVAAEAGQRKAAVSRLEGTVRELKSVVNRREEELVELRARVGELERERERLAAQPTHVRPTGQPTAGAGAVRDVDPAAFREARPTLPTASQSRPPVSTAVDDGAAWSLLLSRIERQWAATVAAMPHELGFASGGTADQLAQALGREAERLREEVGLNAQVRLNGPVPDAQRVGLLLAAGEAIAVLAADGEQVEVDIGPGVVIRGVDWDGELSAFDTVARAAGEAGVELVIESSADGVRLALGSPVGAAADR